MTVGISQPLNPVRHQCWLVNEPVAHTLKFLDAQVPSPLIPVRRISSVPPLEHRGHAIETEAIFDVPVEKAPCDVALDGAARLHNGIGTLAAFVAALEIGNTPGQGRRAAGDLAKELIAPA